MSPQNGVGELLIGQAQLAQQLMRAYGLKGDLPLQYVAPVLGAVAQIEDFSSIEYRVLRSMRTYSAFVNSVAVAAQVSGIVFGTTAQRGNVIAVVRPLYVVNPGAVACAIRMQVNSDQLKAVALATGGLAHDDRVNPAFSLAQSSFGVGTYSNGAALIAGALEVNAAAGATVFLPTDLQFVVSNKPINGAASTGSRLYVEGNVVNQDVRVGLLWYERELLDTESV